MKTLVLDLRDQIVVDVVSGVTHRLASTDVVKKIMDALRSSDPKEQDALKTAAAFLGAEAPEVRGVNSADVVPGKLLVDNAGVIEGDEITACRQGAQEEHSHRTR